MQTQAAAAKPDEDEAVKPDDDNACIDEPIFAAENAAEVDDDPPASDEAPVEEAPQGSSIQISANPLGSYGKIVTNPLGSYAKDPLGMYK